MQNLTTVQLSGRHVFLESFIESHRIELCAAAQDERIWTYNSAKAFGHHFDDRFKSRVLGHPLAPRLSTRKDLVFHDFFKS
jgi:hypothetical protein